MTSEASPQTDEACDAGVRPTPAVAPRCGCKRRCKSRPCMARPAFATDEWNEGRGSVATMYPACCWERTLPGPDGIRTRQPHHGSGLEDPGLLQACGASVRPVLPSCVLAPRNRWRLSRREVVSLDYPASAWYSPSVVSNAHAVRKFLFANATAAIFVPRRAATSTAQRLRRSERLGAVRRAARAPWMTTVRR